MENIQFFCPAYRINQRDKNLEFFCQNLGMKVLLEEGAMVYLGGAEKKLRLILEESPISQSYRAVIGNKRHQLTELKVSPSDFKVLINKNKIPENQVKSLGENKFGFILTSPENDKFCIQSTLSSEELSRLPENSVPIELRPLKDFIVTGMKLNLKNAEAGTELEKAMEIALENSEDSFRLESEVIEGETADLEARNTWDFESFECRVSKGFDLAVLAGKFEKTFKNVDIYLDRAEKILSIKLSMGVEFWFEK